MSEVVPARNYGRRQDDPKSLLYHRKIRKALVILGASGGAAWCLGPFFVWWLNTQYAEKVQALADIQNLQKEVSNVKTEIGNLKSTDTAMAGNLNRIEDKVDAILLNIQGIGKRLTGSNKTMIMMDKSNTLFCRDGWDVWVPTVQIDDFRKKNPTAVPGGCP